MFTKIYTNKFDRYTISDAKHGLILEENRKFFETMVFRSEFSFSIYELREVFDRYVGLSLEAAHNDPEISTAEQEFYRITNHGNKKIGEICLNRRNRIRLSFHQNLARRDFLEIIGRFVEKSPDPETIFKKALELAEIVKDSEARSRLENLAKESLQTPGGTNVSNWEQKLWKPDQHKPLTDSRISTNMQVLTATAKLSRKD